MEFYHNPRCRKSREALALLEEKNINPEIRLYLENPPSKKELQAILKKLKLSPDQIIRKTEAVYKDNYKGKTLSDAQWIDAMVKHPKLIERPIFIKGSKAVIGRPPELVLDIA
jgi:arsenate reductase